MDGLVEKLVWAVQQFNVTQVMLVDSIFLLLKD